MALHSNRWCITPNWRSDASLQIELKHSDPLYLLIFKFLPNLDSSYFLPTISPFFQQIVINFHIAFDIIIPFHINTPFICSPKPSRDLFRCPAGTRCSVVNNCGNCLLFIIFFLSVWSFWSLKNISILFNCQPTAFSEQDWTSQWRYTAFAYCSPAVWLDLQYCRTYVY